MNPCYEKNSWSRANFLPGGPLPQETKDSNSSSKRNTTPLLDEVKIYLVVRTQTRLLGTPYHMTRGTSHPL